MVIYGTYSRLYWAFPLFDMRVTMFPYSADPADLIARMDQVEQNYRIWPGKGGERE
jgi:hypothetical protein